MVTDIRYAIRLIGRQPGATLVAVMTMALGIGATTTLFSVAYGVLLKPLPWPEADRVVRAIETRKGQAARIPGTITNGSFLAWNATPSSTIEALGGYFGSPSAAGFAGSVGTAVLPGAEPVRLPFARVTASLFTVLHARPLRGRLFLPGEGPAGPSAPTVGIISYGLWQERFGGRDDAVGQVGRIDDVPFTIVGIMPRDFAFPDRETRAWFPSIIGGVIGEGGVRRIQIFSALARLRPGVTPAQAAAEATARARSGPDPGLAAVGMFGSSAPPDISVVRAADMMTAEVRPAILVLLAAVVLLLVSATGSVAGVQLARATTRRREIAVRAALGAGSGRLARQLLVESTLVAACGGALGVLLTVVLHRALPSILPADFPRVTDIAIDGRVLLFATLISLATGIVCGLLPALQTRRLSLVDALAEGTAASAEGATRSSGARMRSAIMVGQVAVACLLLVGAALLARSFVSLIRADRGYDPANVLTARIDLPARYTVPRRVAFADAIVERLRAYPGVSHAAAGNALPFISGGGNFPFELPSPGNPGIKLQARAFIRVVSPDYLQTLRLRLVAGRTLLETDTLTSRPVIVVNRSFARSYLGDSPIGARVPMSFGEGRPDCDVVGVVDDMRQGAVTEPQTAEAFASYRQLPARLASAPLIVAARAAGDPAALVPALRAAVREQDPMLVPDSIMTMEERVMTSLARPRTYAVLLSGFACFALLIAAVGLFGVLSYAVAQRAREIGVRTALGARSRDIVVLFLRQGCAIAAAGTAIGLAVSFALARYLESFLYGTSAHDAWTFAIVPVVLTAVSAIACAIPARRAAQLDPLEVLRAG